MASVSISYLRTAKLAELLSQANKQVCQDIWLHEGRLVLGVAPDQKIFWVNFAEECLSSFNGPTTTSDIVGVLQASDKKPEQRLRPFRASGKYELLFRGESVPCRSLREGLAEGLRRLELAKPGTLEKLSQIKGRTKRVVARLPSDLFTDAALVETYSEELMEGWWFGTNNSADETRKFLEQGCNLAGFEWLKDVALWG